MCQERRIRRVVWTADILSDSPRDAAERARAGEMTEFVVDGENVDLSADGESGIIADESGNLLGIVEFTEIPESTRRAVAEILKQRGFTGYADPPRKSWWRRFREWSEN